MFLARAAFVLVLTFSLSVFAAPPAEKKPLKFGISPAHGPELAQKAKTLIEPYLTQALGSPVTVVILPSYEELSDALATGAVDLAWITPLAFVRASQKNAYVQALSKAMRSGDGGLTYRAVLAVKSDSPMKTLADLKGKRVAWVNKLSTSGYLFPRELLRKSGEDPDKFFASETFADNHPAACKLVREGKADVVATFAAGASALKADGCADAPPVTDFRVVASTENLPNEVIAASSDFPSPRVNDVIATFGRMGKNDAGKKLLAEAFRCNGWGVAVEGDFAPVIALINAKDAKPLVAPAEPKKK